MFEERYSLVLAKLRTWPAFGNIAGRLLLHNGMIDVVYAGVGFA